MSAEGGHLVPPAWLEAHGLTQDDLVRIAADLAKPGKLRLLDPLPRHVRLRLWLTSRIDHLGCWLVEHDHIRAARLLWRI